MADQPQRPEWPALRPPAAREPVTGAELAGLGLGVLWLVLAVIFFLLLPEGSGEGTITFVMTLLAIVMPVALIWVALAAARASRTMREESRRLQAAIDGMRASMLADRNARAQSGAARPAEGPGPTPTFQTSREPPRRGPAKPAEADDQPSLLPAEAASPPLMRSDLILALNFPENDQDAAGIAALRRALKDRTARQLVQASQDVLTLLSQNGIYMDDLEPDRARPEVWRRFAQGERGRSVAALGGIRDRTSLALTIQRMREDTIFRDAGHHFLRLFDRTLVQFEPQASDEELAAFADTRTARAFMLLGRVSGTFD